MDLILNIPGMDMEAHFSLWFLWMILGFLAIVILGLAGRHDRTRKPGQPSTKEEARARRSSAFLGRF